MASRGHYHDHRTHETASTATRLQPSPFEAPVAGERVWPRYPRSADQRGDHKAARHLIITGALNPASRWQYLGEAA